jgi:hypothetical protein
MPADPAILERLFQMRKVEPNADGTMFRGVKYTGHTSGLADLTDEGLDSWIAAIYKLYEAHPDAETHHAQTQPQLLAALLKERDRRQGA